MLFDRKAEPETILACPRDARPMIKLRVDSTTLDRCEGCGGTWFDAKELARVADDKEVEALASRIPINAVNSPFDCPACGARCVEGRVDEVAVDTCMKCHGVWLDRGELGEAKRLVQTDRIMRSQGPGFRTFLARL